MSTITLIEIKDVETATDLDAFYVGIVEGQWYHLVPFYGDFIARDGGKIYEAREMDILFRLPKVGEVIDQEIGA